MTARLTACALGTVLVVSLVLVGTTLRGNNDLASVDDLAFAAAAPVAARPVDPAAAVVGSVLAPAPRWVRTSASRTGIPVPAVRAYAHAALVLGSEQPACHLGWTTLAGIGWVESQHGSLGGRVLGDDGRLSAPIAGPSLDGSGDVAAIREQGGWARARGPMQFLSSTWQRWAADGDQDGVADVGDLDDAALAAGRYLCADTHDLATAVGWSAAITSYNHSQAYVDAVLAAADTYNERLS